MTQLTTKASSKIYEATSQQSPGLTVPKRWLRSITTLILVASGLSVQAGDLEDKLNKIRETKKVPGLIVASIGPKGVIESAAVGVRKTGTENAILLDDQFALGSNTKSFTATLAAVLVEDGVINWSTTIADVWPDQPIDKKFQNVTLEQLLAHTGGLHSNLDAGVEWASFFGEKSSPEKERQRMCSLVLHKPPQATVGKHVYSNLGYVAASAMLEKRGKQPFESLMEQRIFKPLNMTRTEFFSAKKLNAVDGDLLWGHSSIGTPIRPGMLGSENPTAYAGCGTIRTTSKDWAKYIGWHLNETASPVLKADKSLKQLHVGVANNGPKTKYGFGWMHFKSSFGRTLQHAGNNTNQFSLVWIMPEAKRATLTITNTGQQQAFAACDAATAKLMQSPAFK